MNSYEGTWLEIKKADVYSPPKFIEFENGKVLSFELLAETNQGNLTKIQKHTKALTEIKHEFIKKNRLRFYEMGKTYTLYSETRAITTDTIFETDYECIQPTQTGLTKEEIENLEFTTVWNTQKIRIVFNTSIDSEIIQIMNKRTKREDAKIVLEKLQKTYFAAFYENGDRVKLLPIKEISNDEIKLYGFQKLPYEVIGIGIK